MADGRHFEKSENGHIPATVHAINTKFGTLTHILALRTDPAVKIFRGLLKIQNGERPSFETENC